MMEESWYAHSKVPSLLVHTLRLSNPTPLPITVRLDIAAASSELIPHALPESLQTEQRTAIAGATVYSRVAEHTQATVLVATNPPTNLTALAVASVEVHVFLVAHVVTQDGTAVIGGGRESEAMTQAILTAGRIFAEQQSQGIAAVLRAHERGWAALWPVRLMMEEGSLRSAMALSTMYYLLSSVGGSGPAANIGHVDPAHACFGGDALRTPADWGGLPLHDDMLHPFITQWVSRLEREQCPVSTNNMHEFDGSAMLRACTFSLAGLRISSTTMRVKPSWHMDDEEWVDLRGIAFGDHTIDLRLTQDAVVVERTDPVSQPIYLAAGSSAPMVRSIDALLVDTCGWW